MRVSACPYPDYGTLKALSRQFLQMLQLLKTTVLMFYLKQVIFNEAKTAYNVTIKPESLYLDAAGKKCSIRSGMEGRADIISKEETVLTFILRKARLLADF